MTSSTLSGVLGHDGRRINCSRASGIWENRGAVKAATSADAADLVSNQSSWWTPQFATVLFYTLQCFLLSTFFFPFTSDSIMFVITNAHLPHVCGASPKKAKPSHRWPGVRPVSRSTFSLAAEVLYKKKLKYSNQAPPGYTAQAVWWPNSWSRLLSW